MSKTEVSAAANEVQIYAGLYSTAGSLHGTLTVTDVLASGNYDNNRITGDLTWFKPDQGTSIPDTHPDRRSYGIGFGTNASDTTPILLRSDGGRYFDPTATVGSIFGGLRTASSNGKLDFNAVAGPSLGSFAGDVEFTATAPANVTSVNNTSVTLSLAASTGIFSGVVTLVDPNPFGGANVTRTPAYSGIVIRHDGLSPVVNTVPSLLVRGFYNVERLPEMGLSVPTTVGPTGNSPIESGAVLFVRNVP